MGQQNNNIQMETANQVFGNLSESPVIDKVFRIDLIFDKILKFLIFDKNLKINNKMVLTLRLVHKHWLSTISTLLERSALPLYVIKSDEASCLKNEMPLNQIYPKLTSPERLVNSLLPFKLILTTNYFNQDRDQIFLKCLTQLGDELSELQVSFPKHKCKMSLVFPTFTLPLLQKFSFEFYGENEKTLLLLQQILNASENLQNFVLKHTSYSDFPESFKSLKIPKSVLSVEFKDILVTEYVEILLRNHLPNLKYLTLNIPCKVLESDAMFEISKHFQRSIISLRLTKTYSSNSTIMALKFPKLEYLQEIQIVFSDFEFELQSASDLQNLLPSVKTVKLNSANNAITSVNVQALTLVNAAFPNLSTLEICVNFTDMSGLMYLFTNMTQLKSLRLNIREGIHELGVLKYSSTLMGLPAWLIAAHQGESDFFQSFIRKRGRKPCLINLTELTSFTLWAPTYTNLYDCNLTDLLFTQTFLKMPKLRIVKFSENIQLPIQQIEEMWKPSGCRIEYIGVENEYIF